MLWRRRSNGPNAQVVQGETRMKRLMFAAALSAAAMLSNAQAAGVKLTVACGAYGVELDQCRQSADEWAKSTGNTVEYFSLPKTTTERLTLIQQLLAAGSSDVDVFAMDPAWLGSIADSLTDLKGSFTEQELAAHYPVLLKADQVNGRLLGIPYFVDVGLLYYRKDLLEKAGLQPPKTWSDLEATAKTIQESQRKAGNDQFWGYVWQARAYEGLTCNAIELIHSFGGGQIVENGKVTVNNPKAIAALETATNWIGTISPPGVLNYAEEDARGVFQSGQALFMRNWPYAWALAETGDSPVKGKVGVTALPAGPNGISSSALGGRNMGVSKFSKHQAEAIDLIRFLTSEKEQRRRAIAASYGPTLKSLYVDKAVLEANPIAAQVGQILEKYLVVRPSNETAPKYPQVSNAFWTATIDVLSKKQSAAGALQALDLNLQRILR
jgi:trehalose/maltose transport system substrate-binding protein